MEEREKNDAAATIPTVQWFPGHMAKTRRLIQGNLKLVDVVIELLDARVPMSSENPLIRELVGEKPRIVALNKSDLADEAQTQRWIAYFRAQGLSALPIDSLSGKGLKALVQKAETLARAKTHKLVAKGAKPRAARAMVLGIPNVGKSSLINRLAGAAKAKVEDRPGVTRDKQWIRVGKNLELLDMQGILWPKFEDPTVGMRLAFVGSVSDEVYDVEAAVKRLLEWLSVHCPETLAERYRLTKEEMQTDAETLLEHIGKHRGCLLKGGLLDAEKVQRLLLSDLRGGRLGRVTFDDALETPKDENEVGTE
ncbi:MAG: ribosome biogenesis GTPase YlqF [Schwartzia sp.]|nr:ribosome biogenesis GTPase YlqF [Schwartzia sp. (in: firmicutes)]